MFFKQSLQDKSPNISRSVSDPLGTPKEAPFAAPDQSARPQVAVFITHGMGQQVPFETLDAAAEGLVKAAARHGKQVSSIRARTVKIDGVKMQRAEFDMRDAQDRDVEVHIYEGYWAPITEGQVSLRDVMWFLLGAGLKGLLNSRLPFERWIFGRAVLFGRQLWAASRLLIILGVLLSLVAVNIFTAIVSGDRIIHIGREQTFIDPVFDALTSVAGIYVIACIVVGAALVLLIGYKKSIKYPGKNTAWHLATRLVQLLMLVWVPLTVFSAILLTLLATQVFQPNHFNFPRINEYWLLIWGGLLIVSWYVRKIMVQYLGDVAAYIDSHSLDRFNDIRTRIKAKVFEHAKAVYSNRQYERIAMMGHSLGSVISYDTLNALINHDQLNENPLDVFGRTSLFLTFGSPLDKTAFIFGSQKGGTTATREALAATLQPLIQAYIPLRDINWINIYSPRDIVSGSLEFYDDPEAEGYTPQRAVKNVQDKDAMIPLVAHIEYWNNSIIFNELYENL